MTPAVVAAGAASGLAAGLLVGGPIVVRSAPTAGSARWLLPMGVIAAALVTPRAWWPVAAIAGGAALGASALWRSRARRLAAAAAAQRAVEACEQLAAELASGRPPGAALDRCAADWQELHPVAEAFRVGADVPAAWRQVAAQVPGAGDLRLVAAAWQVSHRTGQGLADATDRIALDLRSGAATRQVVAGELASARATARLVALLPVAALAMGSGVGGDPWGFLLRTPIGLGALTLGLLFGWVGLAWIERIAAGVTA